MIDELARRRADKAQDSRLWSPADALADALEQIASGNAKPKQIAIHWLEDIPDGAEHHYIVAGMTYPEHIALLHVALDRVIREWRK